MKAFKTHVQTHANGENELKAMQKWRSEKEEVRRDERAERKENREEQIKEREES